jgi:hypothetical protein
MEVGRRRSVGRRAHGDATVRRDELVTIRSMFSVQICSRILLRHRYSAFS